MVLYLLAFKDEPLVKVGVTAEPLSRWSQLGDAWFDFARSWMVRARNPSLIRALERSLKAAFADHRRDLPARLPSGNTEVFDQAILPAALRFIKSCRASLPDAGLSLQRDLTAMVGRVPQAAATPVTREAAQARLFEKHRREIAQTVAENRAKLEELKGVASSIRNLERHAKILARPFTGTA